MKYVVGTAGHVDHGKSTLVAAITGTHPDRLKEEQAREMTIELGFAWFNLPDGSPVGIVDVPGHRDFIENMLAGVGMIDAAIFVIAADEGIMPQTREHLAILDLLQIHGGVIALTKCDLIEDEAWLELVEEDIRRVVNDTVMKDAAIIRVSAVTKMGISELIGALAKVLMIAPVRQNYQQPRLPVDRVFTMTGFGTVVTGTLIDGDLKTGEDVVVLPSERKGRIRGIQTHKKKEAEVHPGQRTALNITGINPDEVQRGDWISRAGMYQPTRRVDAEFKFLHGDYAPIRHHHEVKFFIGTRETRAFVRPIMKDELTPGTTSFIQLDLVEPIIARKGDRFIIRRPSPAETIGGGVILDPNPLKRYRRFDQSVESSFLTKKEGSPRDRLLQTIELLTPIEHDQLKEKSSLSQDEINDSLRDLIESRDVRRITGGKTNDTDFLLSAQWISRLEREMVENLQGYHDANPLKPGIPREEIRSKLGIDSRLYPSLLMQWNLDGVIKELAGFVSLPDFQIRLNPIQQKKVDELLGLFQSNPTNPPSVKQCIEQVGDPIYQVLINNRTLVQLSEDVVFRSTDLEIMKMKTIDLIRQKQKITLAEVRDLFSSSRKYVQAFLEYLDQIELTQRRDDYRVLHPKAQRILPTAADKS